ncbi:antitoxin MazE-like protein [Rhizobium sp. 18055]|jgi:hypothetical protein|uniref:antitoxin MazE-like protein n=1 Tax=Rhizobium sp. 18055 TaxID=2681403 RepID=UPI001FCF13C6|nr:antitoxin MazE-like protein [Rhizobium sp. 18055]
MSAAAERMKALRERRKANHLREVRIFVPDARDPSVKARIAAAIAALDPADEEDAMRWIEAVSEFDNEDLSDTE